LLTDLFFLFLVQAVTWLPVDAAATAILDIVKHSGNPSPPIAYLNLVHPRPTPWDDIFKAAADHLHLDFVSYDKWVELLGLKENALSDQNLGASEDLRGFLSGGQFGESRFRVDVTLESCPSLKDVKALEGVDLIKSIDFWSF
jgi:hypothetical protein